MSEPNTFLFFFFVNAILTTKRCTRLIFFLLLLSSIADILQYDWIAEKKPTGRENHQQPFPRSRVVRNDLSLLKFKGERKDEKEYGHTYMERELDNLESPLTYVGMTST